MANLSGAPPGERKAPDPAATGSSAEIPNLAGGHNRHTTGDHAPQSEAPIVTRYSPTLDALRPGCGEDERRRRCGILYLRDRATAAKRVAGWEASMVLQTIENLACEHAFATMPAAELEVLHHGMVRLMMVANALDMRGPRGNV